MFETKPVEEPHTRPEPITIPRPDTKPEKEPKPGIDPFLDPKKTPAIEPAKN